MTIDQKAESLIAVAARLIDLMNREVALLREMRTAELDTLRDEKLALVEAYELQYRRLAENGKQLAHLQPALRREFEEVARRFAKTLAINGRALTAAKLAHERVVGALVEAIHANRKTGRGYAPDGGLERTSASGPVSLSLDCRL